MTTLVKNQQSAPVAYLLWLLCFLGLCGVHRFYTGRWVTGIIWLLTGGVFLIGQIIDLFLIPGQCRFPKPYGDPDKYVRVDASSGERV